MMNIVRKNPWIAAAILFGGALAAERIPYLLWVIQHANQGAIDAMISSAFLAALIVLAVVYFVTVLKPQSSSGNNRQMNRGNEKS